MKDVQKLRAFVQFLSFGKEVALIWVRKQEMTYQLRPKEKMMKEEIRVCVMHECKGAHIHTYPQILVPIRNRMTIRVEDEEFQLSPKELCFIPQGMEHVCDFFGELLVMNLTGDIAEQESAVLNVPMALPMHGQILQLVELIQAELRENPQSLAVQYLYRYLYSKLTEQCTSPSLRYIRDHFDLPVTVEYLAKLEKYNVNYYTDWFKRRTGMSPGTYLRNVRIRKAKEYLSESGYGLTDIAVMVGYSSNATFTRAFHTVTGMTPKEYRNCDCFRKKLGERNPLWGRKTGISREHGLDENRQIQ